MRENSVEETEEQPTPQNSRTDSGVHADTPIPESVNTTPRLSTAEPAITEGESVMELKETTTKVTIESSEAQTQNDATSEVTSTP